MKKTVKHSLSLLSLLLAAIFLLTACTGPAGERGLQGIQGEQGTPGTVVTVGENGNWYLDGVDTGVKAAGTPGANGSIVTVGEDGYWYIDGARTGVKAVGTSGTVVTIGEDGYWYLDGVKTNVKAGEVEQETAYTPILRFAVASDIHVRDNAENDYNSRNQLASYLSTAYAYSEAQTDYGKLDGIFFVGDITQSGTDTEFADFFSIVNTYVKDGTISRAVLGNHEFYATQYDDGTNSDIRYSDTSVQNTNERFMEYGGYEAVDAHLVIGGYHFIFLSMDRYDKSQSNFFTDAKLEWLDNELTAAAYDDPTGTKPIFVFQHEPPKDTMLGSTTTASDADLTEVLARYPQVVDFSGHTHRPITDPRSIWQGTFTALCTGSLAYLGVNIAGHSKYGDSGVAASDAEGAWTTSNTENQIRNAGMYYIVEVDESHTVRVLVYDIFTNQLWGEPRVFTVGDPDEFIYTADRGNTALKPIWEDGAAATVTNDFYKKLTLSIPQATCPAVVQNYRVDVYSDNTFVKSVYSLACTYYGAATPERVTVSILGLEAASTYMLKIYAVNSWGRASAPMVLTVTTSAATNTGTTPMPDILQTVFNTDGTAINAVTGEALTVWGAPAVEEDAALGMNTAYFDGKDDAYTFHDMAYWYDIIGKSFTLETYVYLYAKPSSYADIISNQQSGGLGFEYKSTGYMHLMANAGESTSTRPQYVVPTGEWIHLVGTYNGSELCMYLNGVLVDSDSISGTMKVPAAGAQYLAIAADSSIGDPLGFAKCNMAAANLYSDALTAEQVAALYSTYTTAAQ